MAQLSNMRDEVLPAMRRKAAVAVVSCALTAVLAVLMYDPAIPQIPLLPAIPAFVCLYVILTLLAVWFRVGVFIGLQDVAIIATYFSFGPIPTLLVLGVGVTLALMLGLIRNYPPTSRNASQFATMWLYQVGVGGASTLLAGALFSGAGGIIPQQRVEIALFGQYFLFFAVHIAYSVLALFLSGTHYSRRSQQRSVLIASSRLLFVEVGVIPLSLLSTITYNNSVIGPYVVMLGITVVAAALFWVAERAQQALENRIGELAILNSVGQALASNLSLPDLLQSIYEQVTRLLDAQTFYVALHDPENQIITFALAVRNGARELWKPRHMANGATEYVIRTGQTLMVHGTAEEVDRQLAQLGIERQGLPAVCYMAVPIMVDQEVLGVIAVQSHTNPNAYSAAEMSMLTTFAAQTAVALRNANLYNRIYELADKLALLNNVSSLVTASLDLDQVLKTICSVAIEVGYADKVGIFLSGDRGMTLRLAQSIGLSDDYVAQFQEIVRSDDSGPMQVMRHAESMAISDVRTDSRGLGWRTLAEIEGYTGLLTVPLIASDTIIGFMAVFYQQYHSFSKAELDLMSTLANHVAVAVANARLYDDTQARARELSRLVDASRAFTASLNLDSVAGQVFLEIDDMLKPDVIALALLGRNGELIMSAQQGEMPWLLTHPQGTIADSLAASRPIMMPQDTRDLELLRALKLNSMYVLPLVSQDRAFGALIVGHRQPRRFTTRERQLVEAMVNQAATAIRNAQLFSQVDEALEDRVTELSAIEAISRKISGALNLDTIIDDVLQTALEITEADHSAFVLPTSNREKLVFFERSTNGDSRYNRVIPFGTGIVGRVLRTGEIARSDDIRYDGDYYEGYPNILSELCVPIIHKGAFAGAINVESERIGAFTPSHERFLVNLAQHVALALGNAQFFEERQQQIETLTKLRKFSLELLSASSLSQVMQLITDFALVLSGATEAHLYLYDRGTDTLTPGATSTHTMTDTRSIVSPTAGGRTYQAARSGQVNFIQNVSHDSLPSGSLDEFGGRGDCAVAWLPLKRGDKVLGVLVTVYPEPRYFGESDTRIFDLIASQAAIAVENAGLFEEVRAGRDRMQLILDSTRDGIMLIDSGGGLVVSNRAAEKILGYPLQHLQGKNVLRLVARARREITDIPNIEFWVNQIHGLLEAIKRAPDEPTRREFEVSSNGTQRYVDETTLPVRDEKTGMIGRLIVLRDVSQEYNLKKMQEEVSDMLVHDLRSPLSGVISSLRLMEDMLKSDDYTDIPQVINIAVSSSESQLRMIESLMDIRKWRTGRMPLNRVSCSLERMVEQVFATLGAMASEANIQTCNVVPKDFPLLCVDEDLISRVLFNLVDNALRHTPTSGQVRVAAALAPDHSTQDASLAQISVTDTGRGIAPEARERVFEMFAQIKKSALRGHRGSGLGLTFCKLTVEAHGGKIWVDSGPEGGAAFVFTLPIMAEQEQELPQTENEVDHDSAGT